MKSMVPSIKILSSLLLLPFCDSFGDFQIPKFPWLGPPQDGRTNSNTRRRRRLQPGDTIAVIGASGNVGKLVALRLSDTFKVNGIVRDASSPSLQAFFEGRKDRISLYEANLLDEVNNGNGKNLDHDDDDLENFKCPPSLKEPLCNANAIVICTGTTAFPTRAWTKSGDEEVSKYVLSALLDNSFSVKKTIETLDELGLNTPNNIDAKANEFILKAWNAACKKGGQKKRVIMLSSIGVERREQMPFPILNACGVLDAKAAGEAAVKRYAKEFGCSYTIVRPGQLFGGPYDNNYYLGTLFQLDKDVATRDVAVQRGDVLVGDTLRSTLAEVTAQICEGDCARDMDFAVVNVKGTVPTVDELQGKLQAL